MNAFTLNMGWEPIEALAPLPVDEFAGRRRAAGNAPQDLGQMRCREFAMKRLSMADAIFLYAETSRDAHACRQRDDIQAGVAPGTTFSPGSVSMWRPGSICCLQVADASSRRRSASTIRPG